MKILIDECLPKKLKHAFVGHEVHTVPEAGWASKKNGELLRLMTGVFDVFITMDSNMRHQQTLATFPIRFILFAAHNNKLETLLPLMPQVREALEATQPGDVVIIQERPPEV
jgi:predicted nuclease of predicted toxin-antitoxin system